MGEMADLVNDGYAFNCAPIAPTGFYPRYIKCRCCNLEGLHWATFGTRWRLAERDGSEHECATTPALKGD